MQQPIQPLQQVPPTPAPDADPTIQEAFSYMSGGGGAPTMDPAYAQQAPPPSPGYEWLPPVAAAPHEPEQDALLYLPPADLQLAAVVMAAYVAIQSVPVSDLLERFLPALIDRFPYSDVLVRALLVGAVVLVARRYLTQ